MVSKNCVQIVMSCSQNGLPKKRWRHIWQILSIMIEIMDKNSVTSHIL